MRREWKTEWMKVRYRKIGLLIAAFLGLIVLWVIWALSDAPAEQIWDGYRMMFLQISLMDTILLPTMIAMLTSRLCDAEVKGDTLKLLCTMEKKGRLFDMKLLMGAVYLAAFVAAEVCMILAVGVLYGYGRPLESVHILYFVTGIYLVSLAVLLLQQVLSFFFENQILPLAAGLFGSFVGLFCWFFPGSPVRKCFLWGFYSLFCFINYDWDETTRIVTYYNVSFDTGSLMLLLVILVLGYGFGKMMFLRKEI